jgi:hypothetical protein
MRFVSLPGHRAGDRAGGMPEHRQRAQRGLSTRSSTCTARSSTRPATSSTPTSTASALIQGTIQPGDGGGAVQDGGGADPDRRLLLGGQQVRQLPDLSRSAACFLHRSRSDRIVDWLITALLLVVGVTALLPLVNTLAISLERQGGRQRRHGGPDPGGLQPGRVRLSSCNDEKFWRAFGVSVLRVVLGGGLNFALAILTAFPLSRAAPRRSRRATSSCGSLSLA